MTQIALNSLPQEPIQVTAEVGRFTPPFIRFFQDALRRINLWDASVTVQTAQPISGGTVAISPTASVSYIKPAGVLATLTVVMPTQPLDGSIATIKTTQTITALTLTSVAPATILDPITTLAANGFVRYLYILGENQWIRIT